MKYKLYNYFQENAISYILHISSKLKVGKCYTLLFSHLISAVAKLHGQG